jgi:hypothetical protein
MKAVNRVKGNAIPLNRANVDTDQIIPAKYLKRIERTGYGPFAFEAWRKDPSFVVNDKRYAGAPILLARENFGSGSSREHAAWAIEGLGVEAMIAPLRGQSQRRHRQAERGELLDSDCPGEELRRATIEKHRREAESRCEEPGAGEPACAIVAGDVRYACHTPLPKRVIARSTPRKPSVMNTTSSAPTIRGGAGSGRSNQRHPTPIKKPRRRPMSEAITSGPPSARPTGRRTEASTSPCGVLRSDP